MPQNLANFFKNDCYLSVTVAITCLELFFLIFLFLFFYTKLPNNLPLLYSLPWGDGQLVKKGQFLIIPSCMILITLVNLSLSSGLHRQQIFLKRILLITSAAATTILFISALKIITIFI